MYDCIAAYLRLLGELDLFRLDVCLRGGDRERLELDPRLLEDEEWKQVCLRNSLTEKLKNSVIYFCGNPVKS